jgi:hypothetical protein
LKHRKNCLKSPLNILVNINSTSISFKVSKQSVYKLMKESGLLQRRLAQAQKGKRNLVKDLIPLTQMPFDYREFDIKYVWGHWQEESMQVMTVLDVN